MKILKAWITSLIQGSAKTTQILDPANFPPPLARSLEPKPPRNNSWCGMTTEAWSISQLGRSHGKSCDHSPSYAQYVMSFHTKGIWLPSFWSRWRWRGLARKPGICGCVEKPRLLFDWTSPLISEAMCSMEQQKLGRWPTQTFCIQCRFVLGGE